MQNQPDWDGEQRDCNQSFPRPRQLIRLDGALHRKDGDHEIVRKARVADKSEVTRKPFHQTTDKGERAEHQHQTGHGEIDGRHRIEFNFCDTVEFHVRIKPLRARPQEAETSLERSAKIGFGRSHLIEQQSEVERHDAPDQFQMLERRADQLGENSQIVMDHPAEIFGFNQCSSEQNVL